MQLRRGVTLISLSSRGGEGWGEEEWVMLTERRSPLSLAGEEGEKFHFTMRK